MVDTANPITSNLGNNVNLKRDAQKRVLLFYIGAALLSKKDTECICSDNIFEMSDVDPKKVGHVMRAMKPVLDHRVNKTKWVILRWPTPAMAQQAMMSTESFEEFFFRV